MVVVARRAWPGARRWARLRGRGEPGRWDYLPSLPATARDRWVRRLRYYTRPLWLPFRRVESWPDNGVDYTGWRARWLQNTGPLRAGTEGTVTGFQTVAQGKQWTIAYATETVEQLDVLMHLPAPGSVELIAPAA